MGAACVPLLIVTRGLEGIAVVFIIACIPVMIKMCAVPSRVGTSTGIFMLGGMLGAMGGGIITPTVFGMWGFEGLWISYGVFMIIATLVFVFAVKFPKPEENEVTAPAETASSSGKGEYAIFFKPNTLLFFAGFAVFVVMGLLAMGVPTVAIAAFFVVESSSESTILMGNGSLFSVTAVTRNACDGMVSVITDFLNDIPRWALNGWTPKALMERKL